MNKKVLAFLAATTLSLGVASAISSVIVWDGTTLVIKAKILL